METVGVLEERAELFVFIFLWHIVAVLCCFNFFNLCFFVQYFLEISPLLYCKSNRFH